MAPNTPEELVKRRARQQGFDLVAITTAAPFPEEMRLTMERVSQGLMDGLGWFSEERVSRGTDPCRLLPAARSIIVVAASYYSDGAQSEGDGPRGRVARYARGRDYHRAFKKRLKDLVRMLEQDLALPIQARWYVDDGPMLDRAVAQRAGIGWYGKNTNILTPSHGSWVLLGQVITDLELEPDRPLKKSCGSCRRCIDVCPTGAIVAPYVVDNRRCISYLTIECRGPIPRELRPLIGDWIFGCDLCQDVCPVNRKARPGEIGELQSRSELGLLELRPLLEITDEEFHERFRGTPVMRAKRVGLQRNACVALGNSGDRRAIPALAHALHQAEALVRGHAAWALGRLGGNESTQALAGALDREWDPWVREEIEQALCK